MKKLLLFSLAVLMAAFAAHADVTINSTNFPDANFRSYLLSEYPSGTITTAQLNARTELNVFNKNISNMKGVEYFTRLTYLNCNYNNLTSINVSALTQLTYLNVGMNQLTSINVDNNTALKELYLQNNRLSGAFVLTYNSNLTTLWLHYNTALDTVMCYNNALNDLSIGNCAGLTYLSCRDNQLTSLNLNGCSRLKTLSCKNNQLTNLSLTSCMNLESVYCNNNLLNHINLTNCNNLLYIDCSHNQLASLDLSHCPKLEYLECCDNVMSELNLSSCNKLLNINCRKNPISSLDLSGKTDLEWLICDSCSLETLDLRGLSSLERLDCYSNRLTSIDVNGCSNLKIFNCYYNQLTSLDVSMCDNLEELFCFNNQLSHLEVSGCTALKQLFCYSNKLPTIDLSCCPSLDNVYIMYNEISGEGMDNLIASLPEVSDRHWLFAFYLPDPEEASYFPEEKNMCTLTQAMSIWSKNWSIGKSNIFDYNMYFYYVTQPGIYDQTVSANSTFSSNVVFYDYDGIKSLQFDIYLPDGFNLVNVVKGSGCPQQAVLNYQNSDHYNNGRRYRRVSLTNLGGNYFSTDSLLVINMQAPSENGQYLLTLEGNTLSSYEHPLYSNPFNSYTVFTVDGGITVKRGDVNGDTNVNITDVTALIDLLLSGALPPTAADCNRDGLVNITDVTALIDYLLSGSWPTKACAGKPVLRSISPKVRTINGKPVSRISPVIHKLDRPLKKEPRF